ncbi:MAG: hypothetical protein WCO55_00605 [Candidatus Falkowbacteria bacterium]
MTLRNIALYILQQMEINEDVSASFLVLVGENRLDQPARNFTNDDFDDEMSDLIKQLTQQAGGFVDARQLEFLQKFQSRVYYFH